MDDYNIASLSESKNEWCARLVNAMTPAVIEGLRSIFQEASSLCEREDQEDKYLMTFQTYLSRIPKWNEEIIKAERARIEERSRCGYLEDLITCVHVVQLKALTCVRVGQKQKCVDIDVPSANAFVHKVYTLVARRLYTSVYLFERDVAPLEKQKRGRELELLVKECTMDAIRDSVPIEKILSAYVAQTEEQVNEEGSGPALPPATTGPKPEATSAAGAAIKVDAPPGSEPAPELDAAPKPEGIIPPSAPALSPQPAPPPPSASVAAAPPPATIATPVATPISSPPGAGAGGPVPTPAPGPTTTPAGVEDSGTICFSNTDHAVDTAGREENLAAPKDDAGLLAAEAAREARAPPVDDEPISLAIREMGGISKLPDAALAVEDVEVLA